MRTHPSFAAIEAANTIGRRLSRNRAEREDLASTALLGLLEYANRHALNPEDVLSEPHWRVLQSRAMDRVRKHQRQRQQWRELAAIHHEPQLHTAPIRDKIDCGRALELARGELGAEERIVLERVFFAGEKLAEVARDEGWSHSGARRRRTALLRELRDGIHRPASA